MLGYLVFALLVLITSFVVIWLFRLVSGWKSSKHTLVDRNYLPVNKKKSTRPGYLSSPSASRKEKRNKRLRGIKGDPKTPWGW